MGANILPIIAIIISGAGAYYVYKTFRVYEGILRENIQLIKENMKLAYIQFYEIIKRHHNEAGIPAGLQGYPGGADKFTSAEGLRLPGLILFSC